MPKLVSIAAVAAALLAGSLAAKANDEVLTGKAALGGWEKDKPGIRRLLTEEDLPAISKSTPSFAEVVPMPAGAKPNVPHGFSVEMVASGLAGARTIRLAPNGDLFVATSQSNAVHVLRVPPGSAKPSLSEVFADGLYQPYGMAFYPPGPNPEWLYVANSDGVVRFPYKNGDMKATGKPETIVGRIPWTHHWTRDIAFTPDGKTMYLTVGSGSNVAQDMGPRPFGKGGLEGWAKTHSLGATWDTEEWRADLLTVDPDGKNRKVFAAGLRNCSGLTLQPATGQPWCVVNERDELGDNTPFEYATSVKEGAFYGWPWYYIGGHQDPRHNGERADLKDKVTIPDVLLQAHSAPLQIVFYEGSDFPAEYKGSAFVTMHGSWNRSLRTGYKVVRLLFDKAGKPTGEYEDFVTGFIASDKQVWGRPVGVVVARDGSLFVTEDGNGTVWRVTHQRGVSQNQPLGTAAAPLPGGPPREPGLSP
jgi:glucose/arabinose dehydrogenase